MRKNQGRETVGRLAGLFRDFPCRLVGAREIGEHVGRLREESRAGMTRWLAEEGPRWANDGSTAVFEVPQAALSGSHALHFAQQVWMAQPSLFEYVEFGDVAVVRLWWDTAGAVTA